MIRFTCGIALGWIGAFYALGWLGPDWIEKKYVSILREEVHNPKTLERWARVAKRLESESK